ncbi:MAG: transporter substrate-binding protein, partial [Thermoleophilia bacterium]|nr:transporter substrate-binding protein [Thermoleophilia bacterium]
GLATILSAALIAVGCGGDDDDDNGGNGGSGGDDTTQITASDEPATGDIVLCMGKDTSGIHRPTLAKFNAANPDANATLVELPESADEQRTQLVQRLRAESDECDVLALDVIWTAEFAAQDWLADVSQLVDDRKDEFIESTLATGEFEDKYFAVPFNSNAGFVYFRTDQVDEVPETWEALYEEANEYNGLTYQGSRYEGLTVHFLELLYSAGGEVLNDDGSESTADADTTREVLQFMVDGIEDGAVPRATLTYKEEEARRAFEAGTVTFMRNWPYAYSLGQDVPAIKGKFEVAPFPAFGDSDAASVLGGYNLAVSSYSDNEEGAAALINFLTAMEAQVNYGANATPPVLTAAYDDKAVTDALPFAEVLRDSIEQGRSRPVSPVYPQISEAISTNVYSALSGDATVDAAVKKMDEDITKALATF